MGASTWMALRKRLISAKMKEAFSNSYLQVKNFQQFAVNLQLSKTKECAKFKFQLKGSVREK